MNNTMPSDDPVTDKFGYYLVGNQKIHNKIKALRLATQTNQSVVWQWADQVWNQVNWTHEPETDIYELYRMRARQIREKYDYVIINYSGGSDSQTVVDAFLDADCHIDEIVTHWNQKYVHLSNIDSVSTDARNVEAEFSRTVVPGINRIIQRSPNTKITYRDISKSVLDIYDQADGESWLDLTCEHLNPGFITRWSGTLESDQLITLDKGFQSVIVNGTDKPKICIKDDKKYYLYLLDIFVNQGRGATNLPEYDNINYECFYWSPDLPEILVKQGHLIRRWFEQNPILKHLLQWPNSNQTNRTTYEKIIRSIIYPQYDFNTFQVDKVSSTVTCEWDYWFFKNHTNTRAHHNWQQGINWVEQNIDKKFLRYDFVGKFEGFGGFIQGHFPLQK
jgi:hypothetical protein